MPVRKPPHNDDQLELFSAIFTDVAGKDIRDTMELPFLNPSNRTRFKPIHYVSSSGVEVTVSGGEPYGIANIFDYDLIVWLLSQIRHGLNRDEHVSRKIRFTRHAFLKDVRRNCGGRDYKNFAAAVARLKNTTITTSIRAKGKQTAMFSWLDYAKFFEDPRGRLQEVEVLIPEWLFEAVCNDTLVLSINSRLFPSYKRT